MSILFYPLGIATTSSFAVKAETTLSASNVPVSASIAEYALSAIGPTGSQYAIVSASGLV